ncbi:Wd Repeat-Containing Protein 46 [Manis pentadactyla]|nr:Wd Repeat-Containing Protein 46 [Manis pentadactyla]
MSETVQIQDELGKKEETVQAEGKDSAKQGGTNHSLLQGGQQAKCSNIKITQAVADEEFQTAEHEVCEIQHHHVAANAAFPTGQHGAAQAERKVYFPQQQTLHSAADPILPTETIKDWKNLDH